jgi:hypothetical protein
LENISRLDCLKKKYLKIVKDIKDLKILKKEPQKILKPIGKCPTPLINGHHLITQGFQKGPKLGETLNKILRLQILGTIKTPKEALKLALKTPSKKEVPNMLDI